MLAATRGKLKELGVKAEVEGRPKHLYSIYEKMVIRGKEFNEIYDLVGVRIMVDNLRDTLRGPRRRALPVEAGPRPVQGLRRDAQVQHVPVAAHDGRRTRAASRWRSRSARATCTGPRSSASRRTGATRRAASRRKDAADIAWLGQMMEWLKDMADPREFMEGLKIDLYGGQVFVFTPKGDVVNLPAGATPVDFAYAIHTDVGHRTIGAKVSGKLVPLDYELRTGDTVEVLTSRAQGEGPSPGLAAVREDARARATRSGSGSRRGRREDAHGARAATRCSG